jgi:membrane-associated phospholipid phosphatase
MSSQHARLFGARVLLNLVPRLHPAIARDLLVAIFATVAFIWIAFSVLTGPVPPFDIEVRLFIHSVASPGLTIAMAWLTNLGNGWFLFPFGAVIVYYLARANRRREAALFGISLLGANIFDQAMKLAFQRPRPDPFFDYPRPFTYSFPSGHAFVSFCFYLTLAEILIEPGWPRSRRILAWTAAASTTFVVGLSRIYLGVHHPSDVIAGYVGAIAWTCVVRAAHRQWWHPAWRGF